ncbi:MAG: tRNA pseudouridine(55) synthase TruB [bacterium]
MLNINKPSGISSYDVIRRIKRIFKDITESGRTSPSIKLGHAGTLDPLASGVLLILFNEATKISRFLNEQKKEYIAAIKLGIKTDTDDITGKIQKENELPELSINQIEEILSEFECEISQIPPVFSALRQQGQRLYNLARQGKIYRPLPRKVTVHEIELKNFISPILKIRTIVSKGTYIRSLARDIGDRLGCGATLIALTRTKIGSFNIDDSLKLEELTLDLIQKHLYPISLALDDFDTVYVKDEAIKKLLTGQVINESDLIKSDLTQLSSPKVKICDSAQKILAIASRIDSVLKPIRLIYADIPKT